MLFYFKNHKFCSSWAQTDSPRNYYPQNWQYKISGVLLEVTNLILFTLSWKGTL